MALELYISFGRRRNKTKAGSPFEMLTADHTVLSYGYGLGRVQYWMETLAMKKGVYKRITNKKGLKGLCTISLTYKELQGLREDIISGRAVKASSINGCYAEDDKEALCFIDTVTKVIGHLSQSGRDLLSDENLNFCYTWHA